eukprot:m.240619 g.240619  ORF g.240619 m.240619 type:complete len:86 (+) comp15562_c0_seq1:36-293(+)
MGAEECVNQIVSGFSMGGVLGLGIGSIFSPIQAFTYGLKGREALRHCGKQTFMFGVMFGMVVAVGSGIRCEPKQQLNDNITQSSA